MNETLHTDQQGRTVLRMQRRLAHPPAKVWRALTEPDELSRWYPFAAAEIDLRVGGTIRFDLGPDPTVPGNSVLEAVITELDPPRVLGFRTPAGEVLPNERDNLQHFTLTPDGDGCLLVFTHAFYDRPFAASNAAGWQGCLHALGMLLDGRPVSPVSWPDSPESIVAAHEAYVAAFGLSAGSVADTPDGWRVRFDRQLMRQPVAEVWDALATTPPVVGGQVPAPFTVDGVPAGAVTAVAAPTLLEYEWWSGDRVAGRVLWELSPTPAGARVTLTQTGPGERERDRTRALATWQELLDRLAAGGAGIVAAREVAP